MSNHRFADKIAVVTGVNDRGIGAATSDRLSQEGATVVMLWQDEPTRLMRRLQKREAPYQSLQCDVTDQSSVDLATQTIIERFGHIDILINNAGVDHSGEFLETTDDDWQRVIDVNLTGSMRMCRALLPNLSRNGGVIVNVASVMGIAGCSGFPSYSATKAGLIGLTQSLAAELAPQGIRATCVAPALVKTPMLGKYLSCFDEEFAEDLSRSHPLGVGSPKDVASAIAFLASSEARWITGVTLPLGWSSSFALPSQMFSGGGLDSASETSPVIRNFVPKESKMESSDVDRAAG